MPFGKIPRVLGDRNGAHVEITADGTIEIYDPAGVLAGYIVGSGNTLVVVGQNGTPQLALFGSGTHLVEVIGNLDITGNVTIGGTLNGHAP